MKTYLYIIPILMGLLACNTPQNHIPPVVNKPVLSGKVYLYGPAFDSATCKAVADCDCCGGDILFYNDSTYILIDYCENEISYHKGLYTLNDSGLVLVSDSISVNQSYKEPESVIDSKIPYVITDTMLAKNTTVAKLYSCKGKPYFVMNTNGETYYFAPDTNDLLNNKINGLKREGIWDRLKMSAIRYTY